MKLALLAFTTVIACTSLHDGVFAGSPEEIAAAIAQGADVNRTDANGNTPLINAIFYNEAALQSAKVIIEAGGRVNEQGQFGRTALHIAAGRRHSPEAEQLTAYLLSKGADVNAKDQSGETPIFAAVGRSDGLPTVQILVDKKADLTVRNVQQNSCLHEAARIKDNAETIRYLVRQGILPSIDNNGTTPLHAAAAADAVENVKALLELGAKVSGKGNVSDSRTPLEEAVNANALYSAKLLLQHGADVNTETYYSFQPFRYRTNTQSDAQKLVHGDASRINFERMTPLHRAVTLNNREMVRLLLAKRANPNKDSHFGGFPLDFAVELGYVDIARDLHAAGGRLLFDEMYLSRFATTNNAAMLDLICQFGANINRKMAPDDNTALHEAVISGAKDSVRVLLTRKAERTIKNKAGKTAFDYATTDELRLLFADAK